MDIIINPPREIFVTKEEFLHFTFFELACFWCNWKLAWYFDDDKNIKIYTGRETFAYCCYNNYRFKDITIYEIPEAEMFYCIIPKENKLYKFITNNLKHLELK